jgi:phage tail sheath protein FI
VVHEANSLNQIQLSCIRSTNILWGNRLLASDAKWQFINVRRTWDFIMKTIATNFDVMNDENLGVLFTVAQVQALDQLLDDLKAIGAILPGSEAYWERDLNSNQLKRAGGLRISFKAEPSPPVEDIGFVGYRDEIAFDFLAEDIANALRQYGLRAV